MAVPPEFPGCEVFIVVEGVKCAEYPAPEDTDEGDSDLITRYIEATPGANFQVHIRIRPGARILRDHAICACVSVDGQDVRRPLWNKRQGIPAARIIQGPEEESATGWQRRDLVFSVLHTDDNAGHKISEKLKQQINALGEITIAFHRVNVKEPVAARSFEWTDRSDTIPEKALKGKSVSQQVSLSSTATVIRGRNLFSLDYIDGMKGPLFTICFKYRSLNDLKAEMIIPRSPSPVPLEDRPLESLTPEEMLELLKRQREQATRVKQEQIRVKRERASSPTTMHEDDEDLSIIQPTPKRRRITIDLTDD